MLLAFRFVLFCFVLFVLFVLIVGPFFVSFVHIRYSCSHYPLFPVSRLLGAIVPAYTLPQVFI